MFEDIFDSLGVEIVQGKQLNLTSFDAAFFKQPLSSKHHHCSLVCCDKLRRHVFVKGLHNKVLFSFDEIMLTIYIQSILPAINAERKDLMLIIQAFFCINCKEKKLNVYCQHDFIK